MENNNTKDIMHSNKSWSKNFSFQDEVDTNVNLPKIKSESVEKPSIIIAEDTNKNK